MKGEKIKEILRSEGFKLSDIAVRLGFDNDQRLHSALRSDDIKTGLLEDIARVTNKSICFFFDAEASNSAIATDDSVAVSGSNHRILSTEQTTYGNNSPAVKGDNNHFVDGSTLEKAFATIDKALEEISSQRQLVEKSMAQTASLIAILQNSMTNGK